MSSQLPIKKIFDQITWHLQHTNLHNFKVSKLFCFHSGGKKCPNESLHNIPHYHTTNKANWRIGKHKIKSQFPTESLASLQLPHHKKIIP